MKIWVITIDEVYDYENFPHDPIAFSNEKDAKEQLDTFRQGLKKDYESELESNWLYEDGERYCEVYEDGCYGTNHYSVRLSEIELK